MSQLNKYLTHVEGVTGARRQLARVNQFAGSPQALLGSQTLGDYARAGGPPKIEWGVATAAGVVAGGIIGAKHGHWLLGAMSGGSIFTNAPALLKADTRKEAAWNLAQTHGGVLASLAMKNNQALGFVLGWLAVGAARYFYGEDGQ